MIFLNELGIICPLGGSRQEVTKRLLDDAESGLVMTDAYSAGRLLPVGRVEFGLAPLEQLPLPQRSRNNQLAMTALAQIRPAVDAVVERFGVERFGVVIGTSTSGIAESESAVHQYVKTGALPEQFHYSQQELCSPAALLAEAIGARGPAYVHSSACVSSAKALASAARLIRSGICDAALAGGVDTVCAFTIAGFTALDSVSPAPCNPLSKNRKGINIGEAAALFLMSREPATVALRGWGESSDGYHISAPDPAGVGARLAVERALACAGIVAEQLEYVNLHGTATMQNDAMEAHVMHDLFGPAVPVSSTKPFTGHALGAASALEAGFCWLAMQDSNPRGVLPPHLWDGVSDDSLSQLQVAEAGYALGRPLRLALSNSFAFGGANAALVLGRE